MGGRRDLGVLLAGLAAVGVIWWSPSFSTGVPEDPEPKGRPDGLYLKLHHPPNPDKLVRVRPSPRR